MEIHKKDLIHFVLDHTTTKKFAINNKNKEKRLEIWEVDDKERLELTFSDLKYFAFYGLVAIFTVATIFTMYHIVDRIVHHNWQNQILLGAAILILSAAIGLLAAKIVAQSIKFSQKMKRQKHEQYQFHDKVDSIKVEHYDYVQIVRPENDEQEFEDNRRAM